MFLGLPPEYELFRTNGLIPEKRYWSRLDEAQSSMREVYRALLGDINVETPYTQRTLKMVQSWPQVAGKERRLAGNGYDGRFELVESQLDVVRGLGLSLTYDGTHNSTRLHALRSSNVRPLM